jgi:tight adherence protein C
MGPTPLFAGFLSAALILVAAWLAVQVLRDRRLILDRRIRQVAPLRTVATASGPALIETTLLRLSVKGLRDSDLSQIRQIFRRFNVPAVRAAQAFAVARLAAGAVFGALVLIGLIHVDAKGAAGILASVAAVPTAILAGWSLPLWAIRRVGKRRAKVVAAGLAEALELLVVCVEAGLALEDALDRITGELSRTQPILAEELLLTSADLRMLPSRDEAFAKLAERVDSPSLRTVVGTLSQTLRYGTPLAGALRMAASQLRSDALMAMEERANRLPALLTLPMMLFIMPTIFLVVGGPAVLRLLDALARH